MSKKVLLAGESWFKHEIHVKGFDTFTTSSYDSGAKWLIEALEEASYEVTYMPNHIAQEEFPYTVEELKEYDVVILSDIGSNTLLLPNAVFTLSETRPNRAQALKEYVEQGGGLCMIGGYMTFSGIDAVGKWGHTAVQDVLPVAVMNYDDRMEHPEGVTPTVKETHDILKDLPEAWPHLLGYNYTELREGAQTLVEIEGDPLIAIGEYGQGRSAVFTSDCAPHWAPPAFCEWEHYQKLWKNLIDWTAHRE